MWLLLLQICSLRGDSGWRLPEMQVSWASLTQNNLPMLWHKVTAW